MADPAAALARLADQTIAGAVSSTYAHDTQIDPDEGVYDCDCSAFVAYLLQQVAPGQLSAITGSGPGGRLLARDFAGTIAALPPEGRDGWLPVAAFSDLRRGDIVAWGRPDPETGDTGHVVVAASSPEPDPDGGVLVEVYDSSDLRHFEDSRGGAGRFATGLGCGRICFGLDDDRTACGFQFGPGDPMVSTPIATGRLASSTP